MSFTLYLVGKVKSYLTTPFLTATTYNPIRAYRRRRPVPRERTCTRSSTPVISFHTNQASTFHIYPSASARTQPPAATSARPLMSTSARPLTSISARPLTSTSASAYERDSLGKCKQTAVVSTDVRRMESSNYSGDKWWPTHWVIQQIIIDSLIGKRDLERSREIRDVAVEMKKHRA